MDNIIEEIIKIDKSALKIREDLEYQIKNNEKWLKQELIRIENDEINKAKEIGENKYDLILKEARDISNDIRQKKENDYKLLDSIFNNKKEMLINIIFEKIINI